jgi:hybrid cluster-associated redox disulfide protein
MVVRKMRTGKMKRKLNDDATMDGIMREAPAAIRVVLQHGMLCVGCPIASFHTVSDAAREHDLDEDQLRCDLEAAIDAGGAG